MPKSGYSSITVPSQLYEKIRIEAENESFSMADYLKEVMALVEFSKTCFANRWAWVQINPRSNQENNPDFSFTVQCSDEKIEAFRKFLKIDLQLASRTIQSHIFLLRKFLEEFDGIELLREDVQNYLTKFSNKNTYRNNLSMLKVYLRDFEKRSDLIEGFRFPRVVLSAQYSNSKQELQKFFNALIEPEEKAMFLLFATSGLRRNEILNLQVSDVDLERRTIQRANGAGEGATKHTGISFFNEEASLALAEYLRTRHSRSPKLFPETKNNRFKKIWADAIESTGIRITPKSLRFWFANEMARLGVPDRFIDAFQGRIPRSVLARHYTDYSIENLKQIYDRANLGVLE